MFFSRTMCYCLYVCLMVNALFVLIVDDVAYGAINEQTGLTKKPRSLLHTKNREAHPLSQTVQDFSYRGRQLNSHVAPFACTWNGTREACEVNYELVSNILANSESASSRFVSNFFTCMAASTNEDCDSEYVCDWNRVANFCDYVAYKIGYEDSPCVQVAPAVFSFYEAVTICSKMKTADACSQTEHCFWSNDSCRFSTLQIFLGHQPKESFRPQFREILGHKRAELNASFHASYDVRSPSFDLNVLLQWNPPQTSCPPNANNTLCQMTEAYTRVIFPTAAYCGMKYSPSEEAACNADEYCDYDKNDNKCEHGNKSTNQAIANGFQAISHLVPNRLDYLYGYYFFECGTRAENTCEEQCVWNVVDQACYLDVPYFASLGLSYANSMNGSQSDPVCSYLRHSVDTECRSIGDIAVCEQRADCEWTLYDECNVAFESRLSFAIEEARDLDDSLASFPSDCSDYPSEETCIASTASDLSSYLESVASDN